MIWLILLGVRYDPQGVSEAVDKTREELGTEHPLYHNLVQLRDWLIEAI